MCQPTAARTLTSGTVRQRNHSAAKSFGSERQHWSIFVCMVKGSINWWFACRLAKGVRFSLFLINFNLFWMIFFRALLRRCVCKLCFEFWKLSFAFGIQTLDCQLPKRSAFFNSRSKSNYGNIRENIFDDLRFGEQACSLKFRLTALRWIVCLNEIYAGASWASAWLQANHRKARFKLIEWTVAKIGELVKSIGWTSENGEDCSFAKF